jgi:hypothetical protein
MGRVRAYNLTDDIALMVHLAVQRVERLSHIQPGRVLHGVSQARIRSKHGVYAQCHGLRFKHGKREQITRDGHAWVWPDIKVKGREVLYYITYYLPRFLDQPPKARLETLIHELYHISPKFNGDLRRFPGRNEFHGNGYADFDGVVDSMVNELLPGLDLERFPFLVHGFDDLCARYGSVVGAKLKRFKPRRVPVTDLQTTEQGLALPVNQAQPPQAQGESTGRQAEMFG